MPPGPKFICTKIMPLVDQVFFVKHARVTVDNCFVFTIMPPKKCDLAILFNIITGNVPAAHVVSMPRWYVWPERAYTYTAVQMCGAAYIVQYVGARTCRETC